MDNSLNQSIIEKVITKNVAIHIALNTMCPPPFEDKFKNESLCQKNTQTQNSEKSLNVVEPNNVNVANDTMNNTKTNSEEKSWRDITDPKLRKKLRNREKCKRYRDKYKNNIDYVLRRKLSHKKYRSKNRISVLTRKKMYREDNKDKIKEYKKIYREVNKDKIKEYNKTYGEKNYKINKDKIKLYNDNRLKTNINYKLSKNLRARLNRAIKNNQKSGSAVKDLGCSISELKTYLESKFLPNMTWENYGLYGWHIDHITPLSSFDLTDRKQLLEACHYTNLQPLWATDNLTKGDRLVPNH